MDMKQKPGVAPEKAAKDLRDDLTTKLVEDLKKGVAPWQKPWSPDQNMMPHNGASGRPYHGGNALHLMYTAAQRGYEDQRWMTFKQAVELGGSVRKGEKSTSVEYWKFTEQRPAVLRDEKGKPVLGADGKEIPAIGKDGKRLMEEVRLDRPRVFHAHVFNAAQIDGLKPMEKKAGRDWDPVAQGEAILQASGAKIFHDQSDRAYYSPRADEIHLPGKTAFPDQAAYYGTALHELGHWTGHESRLNREGITGGHAFGSTEYAKEELRAELASYFLAARTGIPHDPANHTSYVGSWIRALEGDKNEIFRAASDAEKMVDYVIDLQRQRELTPEQIKEVEQEAQPEVAKMTYWHDAAQGEYGYSLLAADGKLIGTESHLSHGEMSARIGPANIAAIDDEIGVTSQRDGVLRGTLKAEELDTSSLKAPVEQQVAHRREVFAKIDRKAIDKELMAGIDEDRDTTFDDPKMTASVDPELAAKARPGHTMVGPMSGTILAEGEGEVYQNLGRGNAAKHEKPRLDQVPAVGQNVKIQYGRDGHGKVQQIDKGKDRGLER